MKNAMMTTATVVALVLNAGMSMAGPLNDRVNRSFAPDDRTSISQTRDHSKTTTNNFRANNSSVDIAAMEQPTTLTSTQGMGASPNASDYLSVVWFDLALVNYPYPVGYFDMFPGTPKDFIQNNVNSAITLCSVSPDCPSN